MLIEDNGQTFLDGVYEFLYQQINDVLKVSAMINQLKDEEYDTDALMEDISHWNDQRDEDNSNICKMQSDSTVYKHIKRYLYHHKSMKLPFSMFLFRRNDKYNTHSKPALF